MYMDIVARQPCARYSHIASKRTTKSTHLKRMGQTEHVRGKNVINLVCPKLIMCTVVGPLLG